MEETFGEWEKESEAWKFQIPAKKVTIIRRATDDNVYPAHSTEVKTVSNCPGQ